MIDGPDEWRIWCDRAVVNAANLLARVPSVGIGGTTAHDVEHGQSVCLDAQHQPARRSQWRRICMLAGAQHHAPGTRIKQHAIACEEARPDPPIHSDCLGIAGVGFDPHFDIARGERSAAHGGNDREIDHRCPADAISDRAGGLCVRFGQDMPHAAAQRNGAAVPRINHNAREMRSADRKLRHIARPRPRDAQWRGAPAKRQAAGGQQPEASRIIIDVERIALRDIAPDEQIDRRFAGCCVGQHGSGELCAMPGQSADRELAHSHPAARDRPADRDGGGARAGAQLGPVDEAARQ
ncbi:hypothetical protein GCM10011395_29960 [Sphingomonas psychrolutea]|uniref:Uncharacterized protein n=1 Tax=Sphingomonas psychrolutea TaxID=1259676 RepID=A0ABQ1H3R4_9SPHN|nr:hypothetical protein GCM10011395_29960 [Sphingomonas psychrolutea]